MRICSIVTLDKTELVLYNIYISAMQFLIMKHIHKLVDDRERHFRSLHTAPKPASLQVRTSSIISF